MLKNKLSVMASALVLLPGAIMMSDDAQALEKARVVTGNAAAYCQSALPVYDVQIRKRPLSVQNEGSASAFVTCAVPEQGTSKAQSVRVFLHSDLSVVTHLQCTGVKGNNVGGAYYRVWDIDLPANGWSSILMAPGDWNENAYFLGPVGLSCNLPPGTGVDVILASYYEDVGT